MLALYGSTMHLATLEPYLHACSYAIGPDRAMEGIWKTFLFCVLAPLKKTKQEINNSINKNIMLVVLGNTWRYNFYMGTQNEMNLER